MNQWNDKRLERILSVLLRTGVMLSAAIVFLAGACFLVRHGNQLPDYHVFHGAPAEYRSIPGILAAVSGSDCLAMIQFGLLMLIATPVARVAFSLAGFALERDRTYVAITVIVLLVLIYSIAFQH